VHEAAREPAFQAFLLGYMEHEATPTLPPVPGVDLADYRRTLIERFSNPEVRDTVARLCVDGSDRIPRWVVPVIRERLDRGGDVTRAAAVVASWTRYAEGVDERGGPIEVVDRRAAALTERARRSREDPSAFVADAELFGDLADREQFMTPYRAALEDLRERGARASLEALAAR